MGALRRRDLLRGTCGLALAGCGRASGEPGTLRVAYMANLTHAPLLAGAVTGRLASALSPLRLEARLVNAGPRVVEALLGGSVDVGVAGPAAIVAAHALHGPVLTIVQGVCAGGASLVLHRGERADMLSQKTLATPQIASTQDVALRKFLRTSGRKTTDRGGDVRVTQLVPPVMKLELERGTLAGAWLPEPWASRLVMEAPAVRAIDERSLWPNGTFASAVVVVRTAFLHARPHDVERFTRAVEQEIASADADESRHALAHETHATWAADMWSQAWQRVRFTTDAMRAPIAAFARDAFDLGLLRASVDVGTLFAT
jgi:NitT/TauT family transport system substrate-binding protein